jgi:hypothetical protein
MAKSKIGLQFEGWEETITKLEQLGGDNATKKAVAEALVKSKEYVNEKLDSAIANGSLPAKGKYSKGNTKKSISREKTVEWQGLTVSNNIGFEFKKSGTTSIFLMYGTPKMKPAKGLKAAIYGTKTKKAVAEIQSEIINRYIKEVMEG